MSSEARTCKLCGDPIPQARGPRAIYCCDSCGKMAWKRDRYPEYYRRNKDKFIAKARAWKHAHPQEVSKSNRRWWTNNKDAAKSYVVRRHGLTLEQYREMESRQGKRCAICQEPGESLNVDHDHNTGLVRDLLCRNCNFGLGAFGDNPGTLQAAIAYLERHGLRAVG